MFKKIFIISLLLSSPILPNKADDMMFSPMIITSPQSWTNPQNLMNPYNPLNSYNSDDSENKNRHYKNCIKNKGGKSCKKYINKP